MRPFARRVLDGVAQLRDAALSRIEDANVATERAVIKAADCLRLIADEASRHVQHLQALREHSAAAGDNGLRGAVQRQLDSVGSYSREIGQLISEQSAQTRQTLDDLDGITRAAREIERLTSASWMLALNAQIEASRSGGAGKAFNVVATEMKQLAQEINHANAMVGAMAASLGAKLPRVAEHARRMEERSNAFSSEFSEKLRDVSDGAESLTQSIEDAISTGDETLQAVLKHCGAALSQLQFQDPVAQQLLMVDCEAHALQVELTKVLGAKREPLRPPVQAPLSGDARVEQHHNGEVLLF